jgi:hypothetical protein
MKKLLFILLSIPLLFSSCQTCKECEPDEVVQTIIGYEEVYLYDIFSPTGSGTIPVYETQPIYSSAIKVNVEICKDNFQSKGDYDAYISEMEDDGYTCRSDFWN